MEIPLNVQVECTDGLCGLSTYILIDPVTDHVTYVVVKQAASPNTEYLVPVDFVAETIADTIRLRCSLVELRKMVPFVKTEFVEAKVLDYAGYQGGIMEMGSHFYMPYVTSEVTTLKPVEHLQIPPGELAVERGTRVEATDGYVGKVDEFVVNPENGHITHLVMREGHLWGNKDVIIPVSAMGETREDTVVLNIDKHQVESLPTFPVRRRWS
ncbi:MAG: PRC-barrel domain-containing protein [Anaerolineales bacterium]|nr:PRC-barrel domain-containing protein [Anaerolineales bacterium]MCB9145321.1 PRC-barrel domain-containing protein [Anaerolineales bacterium]